MFIRSGLCGAGVWERVCFGVWDKVRRVGMVRGSGRPMTAPTVGEYYVYTFCDCAGRGFGSGFVLGCETRYAASAWYEGAGGR